MDPSGEHSQPLARLFKALCQARDANKHPVIPDTDKAGARTQQAEPTEIDEPDDLGSLPPLLNFTTEMAVTDVGVSDKEALPYNGQDSTEQAEETSDYDREGRSE